MSRNDRRQGFMGARVCTAAPSPHKNRPLAAQLKVAFQRFLLILGSKSLAK